MSLQQSTSRITLQKWTTWNYVWDLERKENRVWNRREILKKIVKKSDKLLWNRQLCGVLKKLMDPPLNPLFFSFLVMCPRVEVFWTGYKQFQTPYTVCFPHLISYLSQDQLLWLHHCILKHILSLLSLFCRIILPLWPK